MRAAKRRDDENPAARAQAYRTSLAMSNSKQQRDKGQEIEYSLQRTTSSNSMGLTLSDERPRPRSRPFSTLIRISQTPLLYGEFGNNDSEKDEEGPAKAEEQEHAGVIFLKTTCNLRWLCRLAGSFQGNPAGELAVAIQPHHVNSEKRA
jgi:hypothetical protein